MQRYTIYYYLPKLDNVVKRHDSNVVEGTVMIVALSKETFKKHEISMIEGIIEENVEVITARWKEYFKR